jgi:HEAT repeat protein
MMLDKKTAMTMASMTMIFFAGCAQTPVPTTVIGQQDLAGRARKLLIDATDSSSPLLRSHAIEALSDARQTTARPYIIQGLSDPYWGVRFTACLSIMKMKEISAKPQLEKMVKSDPNTSVRAAAAGTLNVLGDTRYTSLLGQTLFDKDVVVRRNTATVLGLMGKPQAIRLLKSAAVRDDDVSVKLQAVEAMTLLGDAWAQKLMINNTRSVFDDECILAMLALARANVEEGGDMIAYVYERSGSSNRLGMKLVAARALAMLQDYRGKNIALESLNYRSGNAAGSATIRNLAAMALGEIHDASTLGALERAMNDSSEDVRIAAALAILKTVNVANPF